MSEISEILIRRRKDILKAQKCSAVRRANRNVQLPYVYEEGKYFLCVYKIMEAR